MFGELAVLALAAALVQRGWWHKLVEMELRVPWLFLAALALQGVAALAAGASWLPYALRPSAEFVLISASYMGLILALFLNRMTPGFSVIALGVLLNLAATAANGGRMPVSPEALRQAGLDEYLPILDAGAYGKHALGVVGSRFWFLADVIPLRPPYYPIRRVISAGDIVITVGSLKFLWTVIMSHRRENIGVGGRPKVQGIL